ncbi:phosphate/phosphite/phosphonate ABC transporter substrate-binding protein [Treponema sp. OMZ 788]|uniref:phosphate/phosphite/phosphonate ABC transporter substrate-binding protein n=1 Tax=Treponema sp. OMZ 788 TaxID=2563664 RepID=UPI0020A419C2|nr:phosphate/phosphite/phosphonate ABC transporter substrate-binding protein [Treponema sp. OMZ 788]UTC63687.1 phosphate/phosphite/phosphonate ABC transporter substrate-binding protein [Treponema sp. OMZ 788]
MKHKIILLLASAFLFFGCTKEEVQKPITMVFLPNESSEAMKDARQAFMEIISEAVDRPVEIKTTTDYNIALEAIISGNADMAYIGAEGYINAHKRNPAIVPAATNSGPSGTLEDALYYSLIAVRTEDAPQYKNGNDYDLTLLKGKNISFVSTSSTSGFVIPANLLVKKFGLNNTDELIHGSSVFSKVLFAGSHQGSQVNLFRKDADAAAFAIPQTIGVYDLIEGEDYQTGASYKVAEGAVDPFGKFPGSEITVIQSIPVLNAPIVMNTKTLSPDEQHKIQEALTSEKTANNPGIFKIKGADKQGMYPKYSEKTKLVKTTDSWYDKIRNLTK